MRRILVRIGIAGVACAAMFSLMALVGRAGTDRDPATTLALERLLAADAGDASDVASSEVREFYRLRNGVPAWTDRGRAAAALAMLRSAPDHGLTPEAYGEAELARLHEALQHNPNDDQRAARAAVFDLRMTAALLSLGRDVAVGHPRPELTARHWKTRRQTPNLPVTLADERRTDLGAWLNALEPPHPEYRALQQALLNLRDRQRHGGWPVVRARSLAAGETDAAVVALRQRLIASGELPSSEGDAADPSVYDDRLREAVRSFQFHNGLSETGIAEAATLAAMNVPLDARIRQIELNLERWRRMPDDFGPRHVFVNIPSYRLVAREDNKPVLTLKVVVGKPGNETPIFSSSMTTVVFSPYWNIPESILTSETAPAIEKDPNYLTKNSLEVLRVRGSGAAPVDPTTVDWSNAAEVRKLAVRQRPGPRNALGHVKFLLPNSYNVYLHDTPSVRLFARGGRAFSHGCVRVDAPERLAQYVLRDAAAWDDARIDRAMQAGVEQQVRLEETIPVHIVYFTAWVDDGGGLHFGPDIYKYDLARP
jgi:murein L,D-transpeptidase YcbB/YkuD